MTFCPDSAEWELLKTLRWRASASGPLRPLCAGSGLARVPGGFWVVADDLNHLIRVPDGKAAGRGFRVFAGELPQDAARRKRVKKDLESLIDLGAGRLLAFPSGSKNRRCRGVLARLSSSGDLESAREINFRPLMNLLSESIPDLNIEGGYVRRKRLVLLQRGNGKSRFNAVVKIRLAAFKRGLKGSWRRSSLDIKIRRAPLPRWDRVPLTFTDGFFFNGVAYFAAAAEAGGSTYHDGKIVGSAIGTLPKGKKPVILARLQGEKIEGIAPGAVVNGRLEIFAVTDADDPKRPSRLFRTTVAAA